MLEKAEEFFKSITPEQWKNIGIIAGSGALGGLAGGTANLLFNPRSRNTRLLNILLGITAGAGAGAYFSPFRADKVEKEKKLTEERAAADAAEQAKKAEYRSMYQKELTKQKWFQAARDFGLTPIVPGYFTPTAGYAPGTGVNVTSTIDGWYDTVTLPHTISHLLSSTEWIKNPPTDPGKINNFVRWMGGKYAKHPNLLKFMDKTHALTSKVAPIVDAGQTASNVLSIGGKTYDTFAHREDRIKEDLGRSELNDQLGRGLPYRFAQNFADNFWGVGRDVAAFALPGKVKNPFFSMIYTGRALQNLHDFGAMVKDDIDLTNASSTGDWAVDKAMAKIFKRETGMTYNPGIMQMLGEAHEDENGDLDSLDKLWIFSGGDTTRMDEYERKSKIAHGYFDFSKHQKEIEELAKQYRDPNSKLNKQEHEEAMQKALLLHQQQQLANPFSYMINL